MVPLNNHRITYPYGTKNTRYIKGYHTGVDLASSDYSIHAACRGTVIQARYAPGRGADPAGWGNYVILRTADGQYDLIHAHMSSVGVSVGQSVVEGSVLGVMGSTGQSTGPHLHFEVRKGPWSERNDIDPMVFLEGLGVEDVLEHAVVYFTDTDFSTARIVSRKLGGCAMFCRDGQSAVHPDAMSSKHLVIIGGSEVKDHPNVTNCCGVGAPETAILAAQYAQKL